MIKIKLTENSVKITRNELEFMSELCFISLYFIPSDNEKYHTAEKLQEKIDKLLEERKP